MKKLFQLPLFLCSLAFANPIEVEKMTAEENFGLRFLLESSQINQGHIVLDCQSFFQKVDFFDSKGKMTSENFISINECEYLYEKTLLCLQKNKTKCFDSKFLFNDLCDCSE